MIYQPSLMAIAVFLLFVGFTLALSFWLGRKTRSASAYFAAHGQVPWFVNGIAFAGDYLSAASFLGICGMIAFYGYDGFLYSMGYLAGWIVALFVIAEPIKRLGKFTFADALDSRFGSRGIRLAAAISTLAVSIFYLIPQMVGAGALVRPLLGLPHYAGVLLVGVVVVLIVVTAGMVSTTWVQFLKGGLLVLFSLLLTVLILQRGLTADAEKAQIGHIGAIDKEAFAANHDSNAAKVLLPATGAWKGKPYVMLKEKATGEITIWRELATPVAMQNDRFRYQLVKCQTLTKLADGRQFVDNLPLGTGEGERTLAPGGFVLGVGNNQRETGPVGPLLFIEYFYNSLIAVPASDTLRHEDGSVTTIYYSVPTPGEDLLRPGNHPSLKGIRGDALAPKLNFLSLMLALFCGTASLPHILIRYYTVKDQAAARKSTVVGIGSIGFFYMLTLFIGLGAMTSGSLDVTNSNMAAPLLARSFGAFLFALVSAIAFTTVLGTVSGLIVASTGAVVHDLIGAVFGWNLTDHEKVRMAKLAAVAVGAIAMVLGIVFERMNVNFLVGWAFSVAASANLPALVMLLFWKGTTRQGIIAAILVGMTASLTWILLSGDTFRDVYGLPGESAPVPFSQPGLVTIPLGFVVLVVVSKLTARPQA